MDGLLYLDYLLITWTPVAMLIGQTRREHQPCRDPAQWPPPRGTFISNIACLLLRELAPTCPQLAGDGGSHGHHQRQKLCFLLFLARSPVKQKPLEVVVSRHLGTLLSNDYC